MIKVAGTRARVLSAVLGTLVALSPAVALARGSHRHSGHGGHLSHTSKTDTTNTNSNGKNSTDRDKGHARAEDRMNQNGLNHNQAGITDTDDSTTPPG